MLRVWCNIQSVIGLKTPSKNTYHCVQYGKSFSIRGNLVKQQWTHTTDKPYKCDQCDKSFVRKGYLRKHQYDSHGVETIEVWCLQAFHKLIAWWNALLELSCMQLYYTHATYLDKQSNNSGKLISCKLIVSRWTLLKVQKIQVVHLPHDHCWERSHGKLPSIF